MCISTFNQKKVENLKELKSVTIYLPRRKIQVRYKII